MLNVCWKFVGRLLARENTLLKDALIYCCGVMVIDQNCTKQMIL